MSALRGTTYFRQEKVLIYLKDISMEALKRANILCNVKNNAYVRFKQVQSLLSVWLIACIKLSVIFYFAELPSVERWISRALHKTWSFATYALPQKYTFSVSHVMPTSTSPVWGTNHSFTDEFKDHTIVEEKTCVLRCLGSLVHIGHTISISSDVLESKSKNIQEDQDKLEHDLGPTYRCIACDVEALMAQIERD